MPTIIFVTPAGDRLETQIDSGTSIMQGAVDNNVDGIVAECGGACACATCHVYVEQDQQDRLPAMEDLEEEMLSALPTRKDNSRLSCQVEVRDNLDGLVMRVADNET